MSPIRISRFLARILRHDPGSAGIALDVQGWASVAAVLTAIRRRFGPLSEAELAEIILADGKHRYALSPDGRRIRANQGYSIAVDLGLEPVDPPPHLYHGTKADRLPSIFRDGLSKGRRTHVHLSADVQTATKVGGRRPGPTVV